MCTTPNEQAAAHSLVPCSRLSSEQLIHTITEMDNTLKRATPLPLKKSRYLSSEVISRALDVEVRMVPHIHHGNLSAEEFTSFWSFGVPLVVDGLNSKLHLSWSPQELSDRFGRDRCSMEDCETSEKITTTLAHFYEVLPQPQIDGHIWKLKVSVYLCCESCSGS
jgi:hypothetical protein